MRGVKTGQDIPQNEIEPERANAIVCPAEDGPNAGRDEEGGPGVQAMVEQLSQWPARARPSRLLSVYPI